MNNQTENTVNFLNQIELKNPSSDLDHKFGPYLSVNDALNSLKYTENEDGSIETIRGPGRKALIINPETKEQTIYWFDGGITNEHFVPYTVDSKKYQKDSDVVSFDKNYQMWYRDNPHDERKPDRTPLSLDLTNAKLGNSVHIYVIGKIPFARSNNVFVQNEEDYNSDVSNLLLLEYKSDNDIVCVILNDVPAEEPEKVTKISASAFEINYDRILKFDKDYEIGSFSSRTGKFNLNLSNAVVGTINTVFYNDLELPLDNRIKWSGNSNIDVFESNKNCMLILYYSDINTIIADIKKI